MTVKPKKKNKKPQQQPLKCDLTGKKADYYVGVALYNKTKAEQSWPVCAEKVEEALGNLSTQCFATTYWPVVLSLEDGKLLYHSYEADQEGMSIVGGWGIYKNENNL